MATLTLVVRPDGRALLTAATRLTDSQKNALLAELRDWEAGSVPILVVDGCAVVRIESVEVDLDERVAV